MQPQKKSCNLFVTLLDRENEKFYRISGIYKLKYITCNNHKIRQQKGIKKPVNYSFTGN